MSDFYERGFQVREPAWHGLGHVLQDYPGREQAMELAGHNFTIIEAPILVPTKMIDTDADGNPIWDLTTATSLTSLPGEDGAMRKRAKSFKALVKHMPGDPTDGTVVNVVQETYGVVQNDVLWDIMDAVIGEGAKYETAGTLRDGAVVWVLGWLNEPITIPGDDSVILPFFNVSGTHDGTGSITCRPTSIRVVCWNTQSAAEAEGRRTGTEFTFRHSKRVLSRIEDAKMAMKGIRAAHQEFVEVAEELAKLLVTDEQRTMFVEQLIPTPADALISDRVKENISIARGSVRQLFEGPTIPDAHRNTGYGLWLAGTEYLDHVRGYRKPDTLFGRSLLRDERAKAKLGGLIREVARA